MKILIAKPIINELTWIVTDGTKKIGNLRHDNNCYELTLKGDLFRFSTKEEIQQKLPISFEIIESNKEEQHQEFNSLFDVTKNLKVFTKTPNSKTYYVAGWFLIGDKQQLHECPKYRFISRRKYSGPFNTKEEALSCKI